VENVAIDTTYAAEIPNLKPGPFVRLSVADNGHGMDENTLERIFDPFFTTKGQGEGTGLGLAIVQGVVASHGGALNVKSKPDEGTTFELYFPRTDQPVAAAKPMPQPSVGEGQEILLVDDEAVVVEFASSRLTHFGYRPMAFRDPREALAAFNAAPTRFAALVTDLTMPHLTGLDLINGMRPKRPLLPILVLTGYGRETTKEKLAALPCCILLHKPFSGEDLARALSEVLELSRHSAAARV
jgi:CheY-like chemotaxis protein